MGGGISGVGSVNYTFARQNESANKTTLGDNLNGVKNTDAMPGRLNIKQASVTDILSFISSDKMQWRDNCTVKIVNNDVTPVSNAAPQHVEEANIDEASSTLTDAAFKQAIGKALSELPSDEDFISQKQYDAKADLIDSYKETNTKNEEKKFNKFIGLMTNFSGHEEHRAVRCVNDFLMIRKEIKDSLQPEESAKRNELDKLTRKFISIVSKNGLGIDSLAAGSMKSGEAKLREFRNVCNKLVGLSNVDNGKTDLTFNRQIADKIKIALSRSGLSEEQQKQVFDKSSELFRDAQAEHKDMHSSISGAPLSIFEQVQNKLHHESIIFDLLNNRLSEMMDDKPVVDDLKNNTPAAGPATQPGQTIYNITIDNSIHTNINDGMNTTPPLKVDDVNINSEQTPIGNTLSQTENVQPRRGQPVQTETDNKVGSGTHPGDDVDSSSTEVKEEPFTRQFVTVNTATIPSGETELPRIIADPVDDMQLLQSAVDDPLNTEGKENPTEPQEGVHAQHHQTPAGSKTRPLSVDQDIAGNQARVAGTQPGAGLAVPHATKAVKHPTVNASTTYMGSPGSSGARSTPSDAARNSGSGNTGVGRGTQTGTSAQLSSASLGSQTRPLSVNRGIAGKQGRVTGTLPEADLAAPQATKAVKHPTVDASTTYMGSPGSSGARTTPSDAARNSGSGNTGVGRGTQPVNGGTPSAAGAASGAGTAQNNLQPSIVEHQSVGHYGQRNGVQAQAERHSQSGASSAANSARSQTTVQKSTTETALHSNVRAESVSQSATLRTTAAQQVSWNIGSTSNQPARQHPSVNATNGYLGSPGSSGARAVPSDAARGNRGAGVGRGTQTASGQPAKNSSQTQTDTRPPVVSELRASGDAGQKVGVQSREEQRAMSKTSPLMSSGRVHVPVQNGVTARPVPDATRGVGKTANQPAKKHPPVDVVNSYLGSPGSSGARSVPSNFARVRNEPGTKLGSQVDQRGNSFPPQATGVRQPGANQGMDQAVNSSKPEAAKNYAVPKPGNQPAKKHPPVETTSGYLGSPGSSAARSVPSNFARSVVNEAATKVTNQAVRDGGQRTPQPDSQTTGNGVEGHPVSQSHSARVVDGQKVLSRSARAEREDAASTAGSAKELNSQPLQPAAMPGKHAPAAREEDDKLNVKAEKATRQQWGQTYMDRQNKGYVGSRGSAQATPFFNGPANKK
ncbi:hypothetical protein [Cedecea davisae]|uniref:hypothetical protein n=1 Tax=Cedecea davisae TaxID=158484 RepID=UPI00242A3C31|nr:hypothetical protein [Cedecea davisae]